MQPACWTLAVAVVSHAVADPVAVARTLLVAVRRRLRSQQESQTLSAGKCYTCSSRTSTAAETYT